MTALALVALAVAVAAVLILRGRAARRAARISIDLASPQARAGGRLAGHVGLEPLQAMTVRSLTLGLAWHERRVRGTARRDSRHHNPDDPFRTVVLAEEFHLEAGAAARFPFELPVPRADALGGPLTIGSRRRLGTLVLTAEARRDGPTLRARRRVPVVEA